MLEIQASFVDINNLLAEVMELQSSMFSYITDLESLVGTPNEQISAQASGR